jgi:hypothetical protein
MQVSGMSMTMPSARATHAPHRANLRCLGLSVGIAIALTGCGPQTGSKAEFQKRNEAPVGAYFRVWRDPDTGCRYYIYQEGVNQMAIGGITIRFNADGTPDCPGKPEKAKS